MTPAQLKAQKKAEKAARRGQIVAAKAVAEPAPVSGPNDSIKGSSKGKSQKQDAAAAPSTPNTKGPKKTGPVPVQAPQPPKPKGPDVPETFSYLSMAKKLPLSKADKDVHPAVLAIGQQMASFKLKDNLARLEAMLVAFIKASHPIRCSHAHKTD